ncbi:MAG: lysylphosphatidylglycerol synthase transmembrane domain-containing protein [Desulfobulbaceae bacterium]
MSKMSSATFLVKTVISVVFFAVLVSFVRGNELLARLDQVDWFYFSLSFLLVPVMLSTSCLKWKTVLDVREPKIPFFTLIRIYLIGYFFSNLLPSNVGGDVVRSFYTGRLINSQTYAAVSVFVERFSGILFLILLVIFAPLLQHRLYGTPYVYVPAAAAGALLLVIGWVWTVRDPLRLPAALSNMLFAGLKKYGERSGVPALLKIVLYGERISLALFRKLTLFHGELSRAVAVIRKDRVLLVKIIALTVFFYFLTWLNVYVSFLAFGVHPDFLAVCAVVPVIMFVGHLPVTLLGNLGFFESVFVFYFLLVDISPAGTLAMGLLLRLKMMSLGAVGYLVYLLYKYRRTQELEQLETFARQRQAEKLAAEENRSSNGLP